MVKRHATALVFVIFLIETQHLTSASRFDGNEMEMEPPKRRCGNHLTNTLLLVCGYKTRGRESYSKKSSAELTDGEDWPLSDETSTFPFRSRRLSRTLIPIRLRRQDGGLSDECCKKACTINEMRGYCGD